MICAMIGWPRLLFLLWLINSRWVIDIRDSQLPAGIVHQPDIRLYRLDRKKQVFSMISVRSAEILKLTIFAACWYGSGSTKNRISYCLFWRAFQIPSEYAML